MCWRGRCPGNDSLCGDFPKVEAYVRTVYKICQKSIYSNLSLNFYSIKVFFSYLFSKNVSIVFLY